MKIEFEIDVPDGFEFERYGRAFDGDWYLDKQNKMCIWSCDLATDSRYLIFRKVVKIEIPIGLKPGWMFKDRFDEWFWSKHRPTWQGRYWMVGHLQIKLSELMDLPDQPECDAQDSLTRIQPQGENR